MNLNLDKFLCKKFPNLYRDRTSDMRATAMCWGFQHGNGWFELLFDLSAKLEVELKKIPKKNRPTASTVKEKYGTLRFYMTSETNKMAKLIRAAERHSTITCETCGEPGEMRGQGWYYVACNICAVERNKNS